MFNKLVAQDYKPLPECQLNQAIIESVFLGKYNQHAAILIDKYDQKKSIDFIIKFHPSPLWETIVSTFYVSENWVIRNLLANSYTIDSTLSYNAPVKVIIEKKNAFEAAHLNKSNFSKIIDDLFILYDKNRGICMVYFHVVSEGSQVAVLKRNNGRWEVSASKVATIE